MKPLLTIPLVLACVLCGGVVVAPAERPSREFQGQAGDEKKEEVLTPLTEAEQRLNPTDIFLNQPDYVADLEFFVGEEFGGYGGAERIARKGNRFRRESKFWTFVGEIGKTSVQLYPKTKTYDDMLPPPDDDNTDPETLALKPETTLKALGTVLVDGHRCMKIEIVRKDSPERIFAYSAQDLKKLLLVVQTIAPKRSAVQRLRNISLEVPDSLVAIPSDFKPIEHDSWKKVESAKVIYKGRPSKDYGVFRAPGGELFIWIEDAFYPWHYLYRPKEKTVEIAFQGLLINRSGNYIWKTKEEEAFSSTNYSGASQDAMDAHLEASPNGIKFRSNNYDQDQSIIEVTW